MIKTFDPYPYLTIKTREEGEYSRRAHSHREVSLGYIREGKTLLALGEREFLLRAGDMVLIPAGTVHLCTPEDRRAFRFDMLYLDRGWWERTLGFSPEGFSPMALPAPPSLVGFLNRLLEGAPSPGETSPGDGAPSRSRSRKPTREGGAGRARGEKPSGENPRVLSHHPRSR